MSGLKHSGIYLTKTATEPISGEINSNVVVIYAKSDGTIWSMGNNGVSYKVGSDLESILVNVKDYGAKGDGITDDTLAIQRALNSGYKTIVGNDGDIYLVSKTGTKTILGITNNYCLLIPSEVTFDLRGATIKLKDNENSCVILNYNAGSSQDYGIKLKNINIDGNNSNQTNPAFGDMGCITFYDVTKSEVKNITVNNARQYAGRFLKVTKSNFKNLKCFHSDGDGWSFGIAANSQHVSDSFIDEIYAEDCRNSIYGTLQGNPAIFTIKNCNVGTIRGSNCGGGVKVQDDSENSNINSVIFTGGSNNTANTGFKIQGQAGLITSRIQVNQVLCENCSAGHGLYIQGATDISIGSYTGKNNGSLNTYSDVRIGGSKISVNSINSSNSKYYGVLIADDGITSTNVNVKVITVYNSVSRAVQCTHVSPGVVNIGDIIAVDDQVIPTMTELLAITGNGLGHCNRINSNLEWTTSTARLSIASGNYSFVVDEMVTGTEPTSAIINISAGVTSMAVSNKNVARMYVGGAGDYVHPIFDITPINASAQLLGMPRVSNVQDSNVGTGFTITVPNSGAGGQLYFWRIVGWRCLPNAMS